MQSSQDLSTRLQDTLVRVLERILCPKHIPMYIEGMEWFADIAMALADNMSASSSETELLIITLNCEHRNLQNR